MTRDDRGLTEAVAAARLAAEGPNVLPDPDRRDLVRILFEVAREPMFALLLAGAVVYLALGDLTEALVLAAFALLSVGIAVAQEVRSERVLEALRDLANPLATVFRDGAQRRIDSRQLVRGDIIAVSEGERAPADAILRRAVDLEVDESMLTGESAPVVKAASDSANALAAPGGEATPFLYSGTLLVRGHGLAEVAATGARSEIGRIGGALKSIESRPTRLTAETRRLVRIAGAGAFLVCGAVVLILGIGRGAWLEAALAGVAVGMAMLPEEFPLVLTVFMVMGAWRLSRARVLTRQASAIETLGAATVLCVDKTGTLTQNRMALTSAWTQGELSEWLADAPPPAAAQPLIVLGALASDQHPFDPMERAFHQAIAKTAHDGLELVRTYGFSRERMAMAQVWRDADGRRVAVKGAPEAVLGLCGLEGSAAQTVLSAVETMAAPGARVLALAEAEAGPGPLPESPAGFDLRFAGIVGLTDPLRPGAAAAVAECLAAGLRVVMVTGDYPSTARAIAKQAGIADSAVLTGEDLRSLSKDELVDRASQAGVFARIMPEQKLAIVEALKQSGEVVAMTGDGVNDAPALKAADIGIAMGQRGAEVARAAADLVLLDDDFGAIVAAVRLGRRIYDNLRKAMGFIVAVHVPIAGLAITPLFLGMPMFLAPAHIAFLEMIIDPMCSIVFEAEGEEPDIMRRPPRPPRQPLFTLTRLAGHVLQGAIVFAAVAGAWAAASVRLGAVAAPPVAFLTLVVSILGLVLASRAFRSAAAGLLRPNPALLPIVAAVIVAVVAVMAAPQLRALFRFGPLEPQGALIAIASGASVFVGLEVLKVLARRANKRDQRRQARRLRS
jgi:Ca2+-transporting ATPase